MRLPLPNLDDRRWSDLAEEGRNLIPRYAPEWTDLNVHDPGITLVELFAWLAEMSVYRVNRIPESHRRKFLALLGIAPLPPQPAQAVAQFALHEGEAPLDLPATTEVEITEATMRFRTADALTVAAASLQALWRQDQNGRHELTKRAENGELLPLFGELPQTGSAFYFGFSSPLPMGKTVALYLRFSGCRSGAEERERLEEEWLAAMQDCPVPCNPCVAEETPPVLPAPLVWPHHSAQTVWEFAQAASTGITWQTLLAENDEVYDETRGLTLDGFVRLTLPAPMAQVKLNAMDVPRYYLRCRYVAGEYDASPILQAALFNAVAVEQAVPAASQFKIAANALITYPPESLPSTFTKFTLRFNAAGEIAVLHFLPRESEAPEIFIIRLELPTGTQSGVLGCELRLLDKGRNEPEQEVFLQPAPVQSDSVALFTLENETWQTWQQRPDFDASTRTDRHFILDETAGLVTFGDGEKGLPPPKEALIFAKYNATVAEQGNVVAEKIARLSNSAHNQTLLDVGAATGQIEMITNPFPATGGAAAEAFSHAEGRALEEVYRVTRAVTVADIEQLALNVPGTCLGRVAVKPNLDARYPCLSAPGTTTVILLPQIAKPGAQPSAGLRQAVQRYLDRRRIIGNRIEVAGPVYTKVTVQARVRKENAAGATRVRQDILQALHDFFDALHGGPEGAGWPFGRDVYRSEVLHVIDSVAGVENVAAMELIANDGEPSCGNLCLGPCGLIISGEHSVAVMD